MIQYINKWTKTVVISDELILQIHISLYINAHAVLCIYFRDLSSYKNTTHMGLIISSSLQQGIFFLI